MVQTESYLDAAAKWSITAGAVGRTTSLEPPTSPAS